MFAWAGQGAPWPHGCLEASGHLSGPGTSASPGPRQTGRPPPPWGLPPRPSSRHTVPTTFLEKSPGRAWGGQRMTSPARITQEPGADDPGASAPEPAEVPSACPVPAMGSRVKAQPTVPLPCCHFPSPGLPVGAQWDSVSPPSGTARDELPFQWQSTPGLWPRAPPVFPKYRA